MKNLRLEPSLGHLVRSCLKNTTAQIKRKQTNKQKNPNCNNFKKSWKVIVLLSLPFWVYSTILPDDVKIHCKCPTLLSSLFSTKSFWVSVCSSSQENHRLLNYSVNICCDCPEKATLLLHEIQQHIKEMTGKNSNKPGSPPPSRWVQSPRFHMEKSFYFVPIHLLVLTHALLPTWSLFVF